MGADRLTNRAARRAALAVLAAALAAACDAPTVAREQQGFPDGFDPRLPTSAGPVVYHWALGRRITLYVSTLQGESAERLQAFQQATRTAARLWQDSVYYHEFEFDFTTDPTRADVVVRTVNQPTINIFPSFCGDELLGFGGRTSFCASEPPPGDPSRAVGDTLKTLPLVPGGGGDVKFEVTIDLDRATGAQALTSLIAHELGHVLGIGGHSDELTDIMNTLARAAVPTARDMRALRYILHQRATLRP